MYHILRGVNHVSSSQKVAVPVPFPVPFPVPAPIPVPFPVPVPAPVPDPVPVPVPVPQTLVQISTFFRQYDYILPHSTSHPLPLPPPKIYMKT